MNYHDVAVNQLLGFTQNLLLVAGGILLFITLSLVIIDLVCIVFSKTPITSRAKDIVSQEDTKVIERISNYASGLVLPLAGLTILMRTVINGSIFTITLKIVEVIDNPDIVLSFIGDNLGSIMVLSVCIMLSVENKKRREF